MMRLFQKFLYIEFGMKRFLLTIFLIIGGLSQLSAQDEHKSEVQYWAFMVRNTARLQEIAYRFKVTEADIRKYSDIKGKTVYPGKVITIPVKVRPATWDPTKFNPNKPFLSNEDARPQLEYEWNNDALDPLLKDDYILIAEIQGDSVQTEKMNKHIGKIDKRIATLSHQIDSIKNTEFAFQYDEKDMNAVLKRMEQARQRYYAQSPLGKEVDSLNDIKTKLNEEINRLRNKLSEYDYLNENAYYFEKNREGEADMLERINNRPGEQLIAESNYVKKTDTDSKKEKRKNRNKKKRKNKNTEPAPIETEQLLVRDIATKDTAAAQKEIKNAAIENSPNDNQTPSTSSTQVIEAQKNTTPKTENNKNEIVALEEKPTKNVEPEQSKAVEKTNIEQPKEEKLLSTKLTLTPNNTATTNTSGHPTSTSVPVTEKQPNANTVISPTSGIKEEVKNNTTPPTNAVEEVHSSTQTHTTNSGLAPTQEVKKEVVDPITTPPSVTQEVVQSEQKPVVEEIKAEVVKKEEVVSNTTPTLDAAPQQKTKEEETPMPARDNAASVQIASQSTIKPLTERDLSMKEEIKKAIANKVIPKEIDPLDQYSESPDFAFKGLNFQTISVGKGKNGPKYLTPVDPITSLKAKIWVEKFKEEMVNRDFKKAESYLRKAIETNPNSTETWTYHAEMLSAAGSAQDAMKEYMIATAVDATYPRPYFKMALLYENSNNTDKAYEFYGLAIEADSSFYKAYLSRADLSIRLGDLKAAIEDYTALLDVNKNFSLAYKERGGLRMMDRDYTGAVEDFNAYLDIEDPSGEVLYKRGIAKVYTGKIIEGCNDFNLSLQLKYPDATKAIKKYCE